MHHNLSQAPAKLAATLDKTDNVGKTSISSAAKSSIVSDEIAVHSDHIAGVLHRAQKSTILTKKGISGASLTRLPFVKCSG